MTPEDTAPDEEFALAITQKTQVRNFFIIFLYLSCIIVWYKCVTRLFTYIMLCHLLMRKSRNFKARIKENLN